MEPYIKSMLLKMLYRDRQEARDGDEDKLVQAIDDLLADVEQNY